MKQWEGGTSPVFNMPVECRLRNGETRKGYSSLFDWTHTESDFDVVAYRVISEV